MVRQSRHGLSNTKIYSIYHNMKDRCYNSNHHEFYNYGGKGVHICDEWFGSDGFINFYNWSMQHGYVEGLSIDRIDSSGNYEPHNCQWITRGENTTKSNKLYQHRRANKGTHYGISPDGIKYEFENANKFAKEHGLNAGNVRQVANGEKHSHRGWSFGFVSELNVN